MTNQLITHQLPADVIDHPLIMSVESVRHQFIEHMHRLFIVQEKYPI